ncbi:MAG TPA: hypothetical protein DEA63_01565 [Firmicutes bacterium]|nr:hypothetical protein [Bacillota bacterium]
MILLFDIGNPLIGEIVFENVLHQPRVARQKEFFLELLVIFLALLGRGVPRFEEGDEFFLVMGQQFHLWGIGKELSPLILGLHPRRIFASLPAYIGEKAMEDIVIHIGFPHKAHHIELSRIREILRKGRGFCVAFPLFVEQKGIPI